MTRSASNGARRRAKVRCAIDTLKSSEEGLFDLTADKLLTHSRLPLAWHERRIVLGFA
jgi:hypothetical protein